MTLLGLIVTAICVIVLAIVGFWCLSPEFRRRIEEPKYRFKKRQQMMDGEHDRSREGSAKDRR